MRIRTAAGSAILVAAWSCQTLASDLPTVYSPLPELSPIDIRVRTLRPEAAEWSLPPTHAQEFSLRGARSATPETWSLAWDHDVPPLPEFESSRGGARVSVVPSYGHMVFKGTAVIIGFELAMMGVMMMMPRDAMKWEPDFVQDAARNLGRHLTTAPVWDNDDWRLNYLGHPYAGSIYYNTVRAQGASVWQSFLFSLGASTFWEYAVEATAEPASTQDLIVTPVVGSLLGELVNQLTLSMKKNGTSFLEGVAITILNPTHVAMRGYR